MIKVRPIDYLDPKDGSAFLELLNAYSKEDFGAGKPLSDEVTATICKKLSEISGACSLIAWYDDKPIGLLNSFTGFSTFSAMPLINIHDVYIAPDYRGQGVLESLFEALETRAQSLGCCKITLEVLQENLRAQQGYRRLGFKGYEPGERGGETLFWHKKLSH